MDYEERPVLKKEADGDFKNSRRLYHGAFPYIHGKSVLEFGCGYGHGAYFLHPWALKITSFDKYADVITSAKAQFGSTKNIHYTSDFEEVKNRGPYDVVLSIEAIEHLEKDELDVKLKELDKVQTEAQRVRAENTIRKSHEDFDDLRASDEFHNWVD